MKLLNLNPGQRKALLVYPLIVIPGLCVIFYTLGGGKGDAKTTGRDLVGINFQLPKASVDGRQLLNKKLQYEQAERDSLRKAQYRLQDPYRRDSALVKPFPAVGGGRRTTPAAAGAIKPVIASDPRADQILEQLEHLKQVIREPPTPSPRGMRDLPGVATQRFQGIGATGVPEDTIGDARIGRLNQMLDKVMRIQHPEEARVSAPALPRTEEVLPADSSTNVIMAVVVDNRTLVAGMTIALRITDSIRVNGAVLEAGQLVYGTVSINGDRMLVHIGALRRDRSLYNVDLQAYDLDGIAGIHIPGVLSRDVAKQSADQGVGSLNLMNVDPSLAAQAASAGIQTVKSFASRKFRQVRVGVPAGYQLLLRDAHVQGGGYRHMGASAPVVASVRPPDFTPAGSVISSCKNEGVELRLRGILLVEGRLWFGLEYSNRSSIAYTPAYTRWFIRDRRRVRRTAEQEVPLEPLCVAEAVTVAADSIVVTWTGFTPLALSKDKELVLEVGEKGGGRVLSLRIGHKVILNARRGSRE